MVETFASQKTVKIARFRGRGRPHYIQAGKDP